MLRIVIIDKYPILRKGLIYFLKDYFKEAEILDSESIIIFHESNTDISTDLIILGTNENPDMPILEVIDLSQKWYPDTNIIIFDDRSNDHILSKIPQLNFTNDNTLPNEDSHYGLLPESFSPEASEVKSYLKVGVQGYLSKQTSSDKLIDCIEAVLDGKTMYIK